MKRHVGVAVALLAAIALTSAPPLQAQGPGSSEFSADSTMNWMAGGTVYSVERAGNTVYLGGEFRALAPRRNLVGGFVAVAPGGGQRAVISPFVNGTVDAIAFDGSYWYIAGRFARVGNEGRSNIIRLFGDGQIDTAFNARVIGRVHALAIGYLQSGPVLYVGGEFTQAGVGVSLANVRNLAAFSTGFGMFTSLMTAFIPSPDQPVFALVPFSGTMGGTNKLYVGGEFSAIGGASRSSIATVNPSTGAALPWDPSANGRVRTIVPTTDGLVVFTGGNFRTIGGQSRDYIAALSATAPGGDALPWNPAANAPVASLVISGVNVLAGGEFTLIGGLARERLALLNTTDGAAISTFDAPVDGAVRALALVGDGVYVGGDFTEVAGTERLHAAAVSASTGALRPWNPALNDTVRAITAGAPLLTGQVIGLGGDFDAFGAVARHNLAAISLETGDLLPWRPDPDDTVRALSAAGGWLYVGGDFLEIASQPRNRLAAFVRPGLQLTAWNPSADDPVYALTTVRSEDTGAITVYAGGDFSLLGGQPRANIAAITGGTGLPTAWAPTGGNGRVLTIHATASFIYAGGQFTSIGGSAANYLARLGATTGTADSSWTPNPNGEVRAIVTGGTAVYVGGVFATIGGQSRTNLAAVDAATGLANDWQPHPNGAVNALHLQDTTLYVGGEFFTIGQSTSVRRRPRLVALNTTVSGPGAIYVTAFAPRWLGRVLDFDYDVTGIVATGDNELDGEESEPVSRLAFFSRLITAPPRPPTGLSAVVTGYTFARIVNLRWSGPVLGGQPLRYVLEAGTTPGGTQISGGIVATGTGASFASVPAGTYYLRLRSQNASGESGPSAETALIVTPTCTGVVGPPADLSAIVAGNLVTLRWNPATAGDVSGYRVEAGMAPGSAQYQVPLAGTETSYAVSVGSGVFYARVRALGPCGNSVTSNEVQLVVGASAPPSAPIDVTSAVAGNTVTITWTSTAAGVTGYRLEAGFAPGASNAATVALGNVNSFVTTNVPSGVYFVRVRAANANGVGPGSEEVTVVVP